MKIITFVIPCFNSASYMSKAIDSILVCKEDVEIIVVNDGSKDNTIDIARDYEVKYPDVIRVVDKVNGGHGSAVNAGLQCATASYFKVLDSDDWVEESALKKVIDTLKKVVESNQSLDMLVSNYVYEKVGVEHKKVVHYRNVLPTEKVITWDEIGTFKTGQYFMMHSICYRTQLLKDIDFKLPEHTFYVDNLYLYDVFPYVKTMIYCDVDFYRYYIGRDDQSVNEKVMIKRLDQQLRVNKLMIDGKMLKDVENEKCRYYLRRHLTIVTVISSMMAILSNDEENLKKKDELWSYLKNKDNDYHMIRFHWTSILVNLPTKLGKQLSLMVYRIAQKSFGFN